MEKNNLKSDLNAQGTIVGNLLDINSIINLYNQTSIFSGQGELNDIINIFEIFSELNVNPKILEFNHEGNVIFQEHGLQGNMPLINIFECAKKLVKLKKYTGFSKLSSGFNNQTQFADTMFEVDCMFLMHLHPSISDIEISPIENVNGKVKNPDFLFYIKDSIEIICECKSLASAHRLKNSKAVRLMQEIDLDLHDLLKDNFRIEIAFKHLPPHWNRNYGKQLRTVILELMQDQTAKKYKEVTITINHAYKTYIKLCDIHEKNYFNCMINVANKPENKFPNLLIGEMQNLKKSINNTIKYEALTALPENKQSIIFLYSLNEYEAQKAIQEFYIHNTKEELCGIFSWTTGVKFHRNPKCNVNFSLGF